MTKELEALERLRKDECYTLEEYNECYDTIETALKEYENAKILVLQVSMTFKKNTEY